VAGVSPLTPTDNIGGGKNIFVGNDGARDSGGEVPHEPLPTLPLLEILCVTHAPGALRTFKADLVALPTESGVRGTAFV